MALAYLFECHFKDGTMYQQTQQDLSVLDPAKSAFYDVSLRLDEVVLFGIFDNNHTYAVDLTDGSFRIDGVPFKAVPANFPIDVVSPQFRLIYFRRHRHTVVMGTEDDHTIEFHFGWQTTIDGVNYKQTIVVS